MKLVLIMGPQGSGKGTVAKRLSQEQGWLHVSTGDLMREEIAKGTALGKRLQEIINKGGLVDDATVLDMLQRKLASPQAMKGVLLDGFPRNLNQAKALNAKLKVDTVLLLDVPDEVSVQRISSRVQCKTCGEIYGVQVPPKKKGVCDKDGGVLFTRDDDKPDAVRARLKTYHDMTEPIIEFYGPLVKTIDATPDVEIVLSSTRNALN